MRSSSAFPTAIRSPTARRSLRPARARWRTERALPTCSRSCGDALGVPRRCYSLRTSIRSIELGIAAVRERSARRAGAAGAIVPDLSLEESDELRDALRAQGLAMPLLVAPSTPARTRRAHRGSRDRLRLRRLAPGRNRRPKSAATSRRSRGSSRCCASVTRETARGRVRAEPPGGNSRDRRARRRRRGRQRAHRCLCRLDRGGRGPTRQGIRRAADRGDARGLDDQRWTDACARVTIRRAPRSTSPATTPTRRRFAATLPG